MAFSQHARRQVVRRSLSTATDHVWTSDDLLANALHRFTLRHCSRRHVSFAPGPLEARKRSSKRRMMNIAVAGGVRATDVGTLMGIGGGLEQSAWRWESPTTPIQSPLHEEAKTGIFSHFSLPYDSEANKPSRDTTSPSMVDGLSTIPCYRVSNKAQENRIPGPCDRDWAS